MKSICEYFESKRHNPDGKFNIDGELYSHIALQRLRRKAIELGIKVPECMEGEIPDFRFTVDFLRYSYTTFAEFYALELPLGMNKPVREYVLDDLFKDVDRIIFSKAFMEENCLELKVNNQPHRHMIYTHYIDYKGIRFMLNTYHLNGDLSLETDHLIIFLRDTVKQQRPYQLLLSTTKTEEQVAHAHAFHQKQAERFEAIVQSPEVQDMIKAIIEAYGQKKRLIVAPERFVETWRLFWNRVATAEEMFEDEAKSPIGLAKFIADYFPNTVLMYATSAYGLVDRYEHIKSYSLSATSTCLGNVDKSLLSYMSAPEFQQWSKMLTEQINQVIADQKIDGVHLYLPKSYMKHLNKDQKWFEPLRDIRLNSLSGELERLDCFVSLMDYFDDTFLPNVEDIATDL